VPTDELQRLASILTAEVRRLEPTVIAEPVLGLLKVKEKDLGKIDPPCEVFCMNREETVGAVWSHNAEQIKIEDMVLHHFDEGELKATGSNRGVYLLRY